jgi:hypothetical protein
MTCFSFKGKTKYHTSKIDGGLYCVTNGQFTKHLSSNSLSLEEYFLLYFDQKVFCNCGDVATFNSTMWSYKETCGKRSCVGKVISRSIFQQTGNRKHEISLAKSARLKDYYKTDEGKMTIEIVRMKNKKLSTIAVSKRRNTCKDLYNDATFSNQKKAVATKLKKSKSERRLIALKAVVTKRKKYGCKMLSSSGKDKLCKQKEDGRWKESYKKTIKTWLNKYGVPYYPGSRFLGSNSKPQSKFCQLLQEVIGGKSSKFGGELRIERYSFDYALGNKIIEFNGDYWHASPLKFSPEDKIKYPKGRQCLAYEVWEKDIKKLHAAVAAGYEVMYVWEHEFYKDELGTVQRCVQWLKE